MSSQCSLVGAAKETLLRIFSGPHNVEANPKGRNIFWRMRQLSSTNWTEWMSFLDWYPALIIHPWFTLQHFLLPELAVVAANILNMASHH